MKWNKKWSLLLLFGALVISSCVTSNTKTKTLNLLVTFGSSYPGPQLTFKNIHNTALEHFGGEEIKWAYTSKFILRKLRKGNGEGALNGKVFDIYSPTEALEKAAEEGYSSIYIQSLHIIPGEEFDELKAAVKAFEKKHKGIHVKVGTPLLNNDEDIKAVAQVLANKFAAQVAEGPVLFMGHGTPHQADAQYNKVV